jgi:hypothetical protein
MNTTAAAALRPSVIVQNMEEILNAKINKIHIKLLQDAAQYIRKEKPGELVYKICCCYYVFSRAANAYKDIPQIVEIARYYTHKIIDIIEEATVVIFVYIVYKNVINL